MKYSTSVCVSRQLQFGVFKVTVNRQFLDKRVPSLVTPSSFDVNEIVAMRLFSIKISTETTQEDVQYFRGLLNKKKTVIINLLNVVTTVLQLLMQISNTKKFLRTDLTAIVLPTEL